MPQSFVLKRGRLAALVDELTTDMRKVWTSYTSRSSPGAQAARETVKAAACRLEHYRGSDARHLLSRAQVMEPYTAVNLKERKDNKLKDFIHVAGPLGERLHQPSCDTWA